MRNTASSSDREPVPSQKSTERTLETATARLEDDTRDLLRQCQILEQRKAALLKFNTTTQPASQPSLHTTARERAQLGLETNETSSSLHDQFITDLKKASALLDSLPSTISRTLEKDDRALDGLQKLVSRLEVDDGLENTLATVDMLCQNFTRLETRAVSIRIDAEYRKAVSTYSGHRNEATPAETQSLKLELEELHGEVEGLVKLISEHHYRLFIRQGLQRSHAQSVDEASKWSEYTACVLLFLTARLEAFEELIKHTHAHKSAITALQDELAAASKEPVRTEASRPKLVTLSSSSAGLKPLRLVETSLKQTQDQTGSLLKLLDIDSLTAEDADVKLMMLHLQRLGDSDKLHSSLLAESFGNIRASLAQSQAHVDELLASRRAHSVEGRANVLDDRSRRLLGRLEGHTAQTAQLMQTLDIDRLTEKLRTANLR